MKRNAIFLAIFLIVILVVQVSFNSDKSEQTSSTSEPGVAERATISNIQDTPEIADTRKLTLDDVEAKPISTSKDEEAEKSDVLYTKTQRDGTVVEIIAVEYLDNGELAMEEKRYPNGNIAISRYAYQEEQETGYNFHPMDHPYTQYEDDVLLKMAEQNDGAAQYIYAYKLKDKDAKKQWYLKAAKNGYTYGFYMAAQITHGQKLKTDAYALYLLAEQTGPKGHRRNSRSGAKSLKLSEQEIAVAKQKFEELKQQYIRE